MYEPVLFKQIKTSCRIVLLVALFTILKQKERIIFFHEKVCFLRIQKRAKSDKMS